MTHGGGIMTACFRVGNRPEMEPEQHARGVRMRGDVRGETKAGDKVILCVDDEALGLSVRKMLLETRGYRVLTANNGVEALKLLSSETFDLVVLDFLMPGMNGDVVAQKMKQLRPDLPIVMLSAYVDLPRETLALVDKSVTKGESPTILLDTITQLLIQGRGLRRQAATAS
jgi:CheY-like chemotaxis protein